MVRKWVALLLIAAVVASLSIAGCTSPISSNQAATNTSAVTSIASSTATASASATPTLAPSPSPSQLPTSSPTPLATTTSTPTATPSSPSSSPSAGYVIYYFHEQGCPYCAAFENTSSYAQLAQQPNFTPVLNTDTGMVKQYGVNVYPTVVLVKNGAVVGTWEYPNIDAASILAQET